MYYYHNIDIQNTETIPEIASDNHKEWGGRDSREKEEYEVWRRFICKYICSTNNQSTVYVLKLFIIAPWRKFKMRMRERCWTVKLDPRLALLSLSFLEVGLNAEFLNGF